MSGDILEAADLLILSQQVIQRVVDHVNQPVYAGNRDIGEVPYGDHDLVAARLGAQPGHHRRRQVNAINADSARSQRQRDPAGTNRQFQRGTATCQQFG
jgi:hypothetical protein